METGYESRITPFLWFDANAEEAVEFYFGIFKNARRHSEMRWPEGAGPNAGKILTIGFELDGQRFTAMNGGPDHKFSDAVSFVVRCETQAEVDHYWEKLLDGGGKEIQCGWLKDKFGMVWQVVPTRLGELLKHPKALKAMMGMKKLDIGELERAARE